MPTSSGGTSSGSGAMTQLASSVLSGAAASFDVSGIGGTYNHLLLTFQLRNDVAGTTINSSLRLNGDSGANYDRAINGAFGTTPAFSAAAAATLIYFGDVTANSAAASTVTSGQMLIPFYSRTTFFKTVLAMVGGTFGTLGTTTSYELFQVSGLWRNTAAVTQVTIAPASGNWVAGSGLTIHGIL